MLPIKVRHIIIAFLCYTLGGVFCFLLYGGFFFYYLFCKAFMVKTFFPTLIDAIQLVREYEKLIADNQIVETKSDSKFRFFLKENARFTESKLWFLYHHDRNEYNRTVDGSSGFACFVFPLIVWQYYDLKKLSKHLRNRLTSNE